MRRTYRAPALGSGIERDVSTADILGTLSRSGCFGPPETGILKVRLNIIWGSIEAERE
jgi:hypothetical protein